MYAYVKVGRPYCSSENFVTISTSTVISVALTKIRTKVDSCQSDAAIAWLPGNKEYEIIF
jgi:hypothetical protein